MNITPATKKHLYHISKKLEALFNKGVNEPEIEDKRIKMKIFSSRENISTYDFLEIHELLNELKEQNIIDWYLPEGDVGDYMLILGNEEIFTNYILTILDYSKFKSALESVKIYLREEEEDNGRLLMFKNGNFCLDEDRAPLPPFINKSNTQYYKILRAIYELAEEGSKSIKYTDVDKKVKTLKLTKHKIQGAIRDSIKPKLNSPHKFFDLDAGDGKTFIFSNPPLHKVQKPKND